MHDIQYHNFDDGRQIAFRHCSGNGPAIVFLPGYMSDMDGSKATALFDWAQAEGRECLLLDYSGCGHSSGDFADGTLSTWRDEVATLIDAYTCHPAILVGSSMGGWLMLLVGEAIGHRLRALVGIASAPDFTEWGIDPVARAKLLHGETVYEENPYGFDPTPTHATFWADGQANRRLIAEIALDCPVRLLHGQQDTDVPWEISLQLTQALRSTDVHLTLVKDGDHRLSREQDITLLLRTVATI
ncbi:MAG: alpha/beta fold hydrolase [Tsuneonella suprasediminis]|uniref:Palmitoyl-protein thioesterase ABHD10, mitochondrial n=1 Tax=Tsuneonella flava TaxID=2055955 RepID=A0ABX7KD93_9SPHN|nr:alpha/beta hydrolase [Tsuneonella flava]QSB45001.1 alpha/beta hydrolase [Tsuneonella flava]UBS33598.1 alpha/beta hydrolase [Altererythrobacter sp. N1]